MKFCSWLITLTLLSRSVAMLYSSMVLKAHSNKFFQAIVSFYVVHEVLQFLQQYFLAEIRQSDVKCLHSFDSWWKHNFERNSVQTSVAKQLKVFSSWHKCFKSRGEYGSSTANSNRLELLFSKQWKILTAFNSETSLLECKPCSHSSPFFCMG